VKRKPLAFAALGGLTTFIALAFLPAARPAAAAVQFGGFDNFGFAAPVSVLVYEPFIPVPTSPQGEMRYSYTDSTLQSGPFGAATASSVYPGAAAATGLPTFNKNLPPYPIITTATYPGTAAETSTSKSYPAPVVGPQQMTASATATKVTATADTLASSAGSVVSFGKVASTTTDTVESAKVTSTAVSDISDLGLMGSIIHIQSVHSEAHAESNGVKGSVSGTQTVTGLKVAGQSFSINDKGVVVGPAHLQGIKGLPPSGAALLAILGITITQPVAQSTIAGTHGQLTGQALLISVSTVKFHDALFGPLAAPIRQLLSLTPNPCFDPLSASPTGPCLHSQFDAILSLKPRIDFLVGNVFASSNGVPQFVVPPFDSGAGLPPTTTTIAGTPGSPGTSGTPGIPGGDTGAPPPQVAGSVTNTNSAFPAGYAGLKGAALLGALVALIAWYAIRNMGLAVVGGFAGCEYGAPRTVPDLRRG
jgi:hypothetical protein